MIGEKRKRIVNILNWELFHSNFLLRNNSPTTPITNWMVIYNFMKILTSKKYNKGMKGEKSAVSGLATNAEVPGNGGLQATSSKIFHQKYGSV